jgi:hypothetical protein
MFVDTGQLHSGGSQSHRASGHAQEAADHLSCGPLPSGLFGEFPNFAAGFTDMEERNAAQLRSVRCSSGT